MARDEDEQHRLITEDRMRKGKAASTASAQREKVDQNLYVPNLYAQGPEDSWRGFTVADGLLLPGG